MGLNDLQGREKDVAIFSTVRDGKKHGSIGFVADERRVNVGLTRARSSLIVIGNAKALKTDERWGNLVKQATVDGSVLHASLCMLWPHAYSLAQHAPLFGAIFTIAGLAVLSLPCHLHWLLEPCITYAMTYA